MPRKSRGYYLRLDRQSGRWEIAWAEPGGKVKSRSTGEQDRVRAEEILSRFVDTINRPDAPERMTLRQIAVPFVAHIEATKPRHARSHVSALNRFLGRLGWLRFDEIRFRHGSAYADERRKDGVKPGTIRQEITLASAMLGWWSKRNELVRPKIEWPKGSPPRRRWLTEGELDRLLSACKSPHIRLFVVVAINTAARSGAILELSWDNVDFDRRIIDFGHPEGAKPRTAIPINDELFAELAEAREMATTRYVIEHNGGRIHRIQGGFLRTARLAGLDDITPHDLRRTAASWMLQRGVRIEVVSEMLGHKDVRVTREVYGHLDVEHLRGAAALLGRRR